MSSMNETTSSTPAERRRPVTLTREHGTGLAEMLRRVVPDTDEDRGLSRLDVAAFNSSI
jgi:hypothetical protein